MASNRLKLNTDKTKFILLGKRHQFSKISSGSINLHGSDITLLNQVTGLGVIINYKLMFNVQIRPLSSRCFYYLCQFRIIHHALTTETTTTLIHAFIMSRVDYCKNVLYGAGAVHLHSLQSVLNATACLIVQRQKIDLITTSIRDELHWLSISKRIVYKLSTLVFKCLR